MKEKQPENKKVNRISMAGLVVESTDNNIKEVMKVADKLLTKHKNLIEAQGLVEITHSC